MIMCVKQVQVKNTSLFLLRSCCLIFKLGINIQKRKKKKSLPKTITNTYKKEEKERNK